jgi:hypothetical protein
MVGIILTSPPKDLLFSSIEDADASLAQHDIQVIRAHCDTVFNRVRLKKRAESGAHKTEKIPSPIPMGKG